MCSVLSNTIDLIINSKMFNTWLHTKTIFLYSTFQVSVLSFSVESHYSPQASCVQLASFSSSEVCPTALPCNCTDSTVHMDASLSVSLSLRVPVCSHRSISESENIGVASIHTQCAIINCILCYSLYKYTDGSERFR